MRFYDVDELSLLLRLSKGQVYALIDQGKLGSHRFTTGKQGACRVSDEQLRAFLQETERGGRPAPKPAAPRGKPQRLTPP